MKLEGQALPNGRGAQKTAINHFKLSTAKFYEEGNA